MAGMICTKETSNLSGNEVFINTRRGRAAIAAAGQAVAAVVLGMGVARIAVEEADGHWRSETWNDECLSEEAWVIFNLAGPMACYACDLAKYVTCDGDHASPRQCYEAVEAIEQWYGCPHFEVPYEEDDDELRRYEEDCIFELCKVRTLRFLKKPHLVSAILAVARKLLVRERIRVDHATALIKRHLASA